MMNMEEKRLDNSYFKNYLWREEWVRPYESVFGIMLNFCKVNTMCGFDAIKLLGRVYQIKHDPDHIYNNKSFPLTDLRLLSDLMPDWYKSQMRVFLNMTSESSREIYHRYVRYCPECIKNGYHSVFHQLIGAHICPIHHTDLICEESVSYEYCVGNILYNIMSEKPNNARKIPHPCFRAGEAQTFALPSIPARYSKIAHYVSQSDGTYFNRNEKIHHPCDFFLNDKYDRLIRIRHSFRNVKEVICELTCGKSLPGAIRKYSEYANPTLCNYMNKDLSDNNIRDYYLYCMCMNFTKKERASSRIRRDIKRCDVLFADDMASLKYSFLWAIKDSYDPDVILSLHWIFHPYSADNTSRRNIFNGIRLEFVRINSDKRIVSHISGLIADIYIIEDLFSQLWRQYVNLAKRPSGVNVWDGWKELVIPEYFICQNDSEYSFDIYRLDPVIP